MRINIKYVFPVESKMDVLKAISNNVTTFLFSEILWILTRDRAGLSPADKAAVYTMLRSKGLDPSRLNPTDQSNCP